MGRSRSELQATLAWRTIGFSVSAAVATLAVSLYGLRLVSQKSAKLHEAIRQLQRELTDVRSRLVNLEANLSNGKLKVKALETRSLPAGANAADNAIRSDDEEFYEFSEV